MRGIRDIVVVDLDQRAEVHSRHEGVRHRGVAPDHLYRAVDPVIRLKGPFEEILVGLGLKVRWATELKSISGGPEGRLGKKVGDFGADQPEDPCAPYALSKFVQAGKPRLPLPGPDRKAPG